MSPRTRAVPTKVIMDGAGTTKNYTSKNSAGKDKPTGGGRCFESS